MSVSTSIAAFSSAVKDWASELRATQARAASSKVTVAETETTPDGLSLEQLVEDKRSAILKINLEQVPEVTYSKATIKALVYTGPRNAEEEAVYKQKRLELEELTSTTGDAWEAFKVKNGFVNTDFGFTLAQDGSVVITDGKNTKLTWMQRDSIKTLANQSKEFSDNARDLAKSIIEYVGMSDNTSGRAGLGRFHLDVENFSQMIDLGRQFNTEAAFSIAIAMNNSDPSRPKMLVVPTWRWETQLRAAGENRYEMGTDAAAQRGSVWDGKFVPFTGWKTV
ncbi:hypothetical protein [Hylemonella gracilis]|uniref:hypothetical protein n=1 Tax=Hylemonella gracilis TaxID=80880 RepID=UPI0012DD6DC8|nr:hypothetical protein [Hylemonella gracilis]